MIETQTRTAEIDCREGGGRQTERERDRHKDEDFRHKMPVGQPALIQIANSRPGKHE